MTLQNVHILKQYKNQYSELQKVYFLKCKELAEFEEHLKNTQNQINDFITKSRVKLKNSKKSKI
jgi:CRISPR/Cas system CSM-associated protein Csm4 (group 5 of RAMP superfamily)